MKRIIEYVLPLNDVLVWLLLFSVLFSLWSVVSIITWFLPFSTFWIRFIESNQLLFLLIGFILHLFLLISQQQIVLTKKYSSHQETNLTFGKLCIKSWWLFCWNIPLYILIAVCSIFRFEIRHFNVYWFSHQKPETIFSYVVLILIFLFMNGFYWNGIATIYRYRKNDGLSSLCKVGIVTIKRFFTTFPIWMMTYLIISITSSTIIGSIWFCWEISNLLYQNSVFFLDWFFPDHWLIGFLISGTGILSFYFSLCSYAAASSAD